MDPNNLMLSQDAFNAHMLRGVMDATGQPGETAPDGQTRCAAIVEIFRTFEAANPMEAMIACQCISLHFILDAAMRDAGAADLEPAMVIRMRASAMSISKNLHLWMAEFASLHARNETRVAAALSLVSRPDTAVSPPKLQSVSAQLPPARSEQPRPIAVRPVRATPPFVAAASGPDRLGPAGLPTPGTPVQSMPVQSMPVQSMKASLLSSVAASLGVASDGHVSGTTSPSGR